MKTIKVDPEIIEAIDRRLQKDMGEPEIRWWLTIIPEAKRYILRKLKKANRRINDIETLIELLEERFNRKFIFEKNSQTIGMGVTEKKSFAKNKMIHSKIYRALSKELNQLTELVEGYNIDIENLNDKSLATRKLASFEIQHQMYEDV